MIPIFAIARAFLADPKILILDDSTSAIDSNTEDKIQYAIKNILRNRTTFLITHRLSQIRWADLIIVLKDGKIEAKGNTVVSRAYYHHSFAINEAKFSSFL